LEINQSRVQCSHHFIAPDHAQHAQRDIVLPFLSVLVLNADYGVETVVHIQTFLVSDRGIILVFYPTAIRKFEGEPLSPERKEYFAVYLGNGHWLTKSLVSNVGSRSIRVGSDNLRP